MSEMYEISANRVDTGKSSVNELNWVDEEDNEFASVEIPWCLLTAILSQLHEYEFEFDEGVLRDAFQEAVRDRIAGALSNHGCSPAPASKYTELENWSVIVNGSQVSGDSWQIIVSQWFAHAMFADPDVASPTPKVAVAENGVTHHMNALRVKCEVTS